MRLTFPDAYPTGKCVLVPIDVALIPLVSGALARYDEKRTWETASYEMAYRAFNELRQTMTAACASALIQELRDLRGVKPAYESTPVEERTSDMYNSLNDLNQWILDMRGIMSDGWFTDTYTTLKDIVQVDRGNTQSTAGAIWGVVREALLAGSSGASIIDIIAGFLETQEETALEGGLLTALIAITAANSGIMQSEGLLLLSMQEQLNAIIFALRGATERTDNISSILRANEDSTDGLSIAEILY